MDEQEKSISLREHQKIMLDILSDFDDFCCRNQLRYFLDAGTLLGAVRHNGFIPWDNDADVCMLRSDYDRFIQLLNERNYYLNDHILLEIPEETMYCFCKLGDTRTEMIEFPDTHPEKCYVYIDVFPKDGLPEDSLRTKILCHCSFYLSLLHWFNKHSIPYWKTKKSGLKKYVAVIADRIVTDRNIGLNIQNWLIRRNNRKNPIEQCKKITTLVNGEYHRRCEKECFDERILWEFEGRQFYIPKGYDHWLRVLYGDNYMEVPPPEKREVHNVTVTWKN